MTDTSNKFMAAMPSVDSLLRTKHGKILIKKYGRKSVVDAIRNDLRLLRKRLREKGQNGVSETKNKAIFARIEIALKTDHSSSLKPVFNLTGTVLHTNLGRAPLPEEAIDAIAAVARGASNLEFDNKTGRRGDRDAHLEELLLKLTGAEAVTIVNNNAAAVLLMLNSLALRKEVIVSRGELIEIGGAFRIPDIMRRAGAKLREIGTTNRTHQEDYENAISPRTALVMKVHTSNFEIKGFTSTVPEPKISALAHNNGLPFIIDLGSGTLANLECFGLPHEPTAQEALSNGADLVSFSGDKLLGGPQAGIIVGRKDLIYKIKNNPMKRAMRCDKMTIAALAAVLHLYTDPKNQAKKIPALRLLSRTKREIRGVAKRIIPDIKLALENFYNAEINDCLSQIGSGSLPTERLDSFAVVIRPVNNKQIGAKLKTLGNALRMLPVPVIGRTHENALWLDVRCLEKAEENKFISQLKLLKFNS